MEKTQSYLNFAVLIFVLYIQMSQCLPANQPQVCPPGFTHYVPSSKCYALIKTKTSMNGHIAQCSRLAVGAFIAAPLDAGEDRFIQSLIQGQSTSERARCETTASSTTKYEGYYLGGESWERRICNTFQWYLSGGFRQKMEYTNYIPGDPNCAKNKEFCVSYFDGFKWADIDCGTSLCSVCEFRLHK